ncbi:GGDEF domain-containing protein [bacterium]|nr:GGDEF domain-containing protein [bacterium]
MDKTLPKFNLSQLTRKLLSESDHGQFIKNAAELLSILVNAKRVEFMLLSEDKDKLKTVGLLEEKGFTQSLSEVRVIETDLVDIIESQKIEVLDINDSSRIYLPLLGQKDDLLGLALLDRDKSELITESDLHTLEIVNGMIGITFGNIINADSAIFDPLTGLYLKNQFEIRLQEEIMRVLRYSEMLSLIALDIDDFRMLNRTYGKPQCDSILSEFAYIINMTIRKYVDIACRYDADQFMVILPKSDLSGAKTVAQRIVNNCEEFDFTGQKEHLKVTVSASVSFCDNQCLMQFDELVKQVNQMLKKAKDEGGNRVEVSA